MSEHKGSKTSSTELWLLCHSHTNFMQPFISTLMWLLSWADSLLEPQLHLALIQNNLVSKKLFDEIYRWPSMTWLSCEACWDAVIVKSPKQLQRSPQGKWVRQWKIDQETKKEWRNWEDKEGISNGEWLNSVKVCDRGTWCHGVALEDFDER